MSSHEMSFERCFCLHYDSSTHSSLQKNKLHKCQISSKSNRACIMVKLKKIALQATNWVKLAKPCIVFATSVAFLADFSLGNSCVSPNKLGDKIAGQKNLRNTQELTSWSQTALLHWWWHRWRMAENTDFSSLETTIKNNLHATQPNWLSKASSKQTGLEKLTKFHSNAQ